MPAAIPIALAVGASAASAGAVAGGVTIAGIALSTTALTAISVGLTVAGALATLLLTPQPPKPKMADGSQSVKQAVPPRTRCYGEYRLAGAFVYYAATDTGDLHTLVCHCAHEIDGNTGPAPNPVQHWLNDQLVTVDGAGAVHGGVYDDYDPILPVKVKNWLGTATQVIDGLPSEWDDGPPQTHLGHGLACTHVKYADLKPDLQQKVFASGAPAYRATLRGAKIFDPRDGGQTAGTEATYKWSDNAALVVLDYLSRTEAGIPVGFGIALASIDLTSFSAAATVCDQAVPLKAGGTEKRWRSCGAYDLTEDRKSVLSDLLDACGGRLTQGPDGKIGLTVGAPSPVAGVTVNDDQILEYDFSTGTAAITRINEVRATYVSKLQNWAETEAGIQQDQDSIDRNGTESSGIKLRFVPAESQAQRIAKYTLARGNPQWAGKVRGTLALADAWGERWIRLQISEIEVDQVFEITGMRIDRATMTVEMDVTSYDGWWDWTAAVDEQDAAPLPDDPSDIPVTPAPTGVTSTVMHRQYDAHTLIATAVIAWAAPPSTSFVAAGRWRKAGGEWQAAGVIPDTNTFETPPLEDGQVYEAAVRFLGPRGTSSTWTAAPGFTAVADPTAPVTPVAFTATGGVSTVALSATAGNSANQFAIRFWRDSDATFAGAVDVAGPIYTGPNRTAAYTDTPGPGLWRYWATAENGSAIKSAPAGPQGPITFTPAAPVIVTPTTPFSTNNSTPTFSGTGPNGTTVHLFDGATDVGSVAVVAGAWSITSATRTDGTRTWKAVAVAPGPVNSADSNTVSLTIDTVSQVPVITTSSPINTTDTTPDISGTSEPGAAISVYRGGSTLAGTTTADGSGNWTATLSTLAIGSYSITAKAVDALGNPQSAASSPAKTLNIQPFAPAITTTGATTYDTTPTIAGTSTASATIKLYDDGVLSSTGTANGSGVWSFPIGVLATGANVVTATQTVSGIESPASSGITMTISALDTDAAAYIAAMTVEPTSARMGLINTLVLALKSAGVWTLLDTMYLLAAHDAQAARLNLKAPATFALTATNTPTFTADSGYKGTGVGSTVGGYLASTFTPSTAGGQWTLNSAHLGVWNRTAATTSSSQVSAEIGTTGAFIFTKDAIANNIRTGLNDGTVSNTAAGATAGLGHFCISRTASTGYAKYHTGAAQTAAVVTSTSLPSATVSILRANSGSYSDAEVCAAHWGAGLTATQELDLYNALHAYLQGTGAVA